VAGTVSELDIELGMPFIEKTLESSESARALSETLQQEGMRPMPERSRLVNIYSGESLTSLAVGIVPFVSDDLSAHAGLSVSQGGYATAVRVRMSGRTTIAQLSTLFFVDGKIRSFDFDPDELLSDGATAIAERTGKVRSDRPFTELSVRQVRSISSYAHTAFLHDEPSMNIYSTDELVALRGNGELATEIGTLALLQTISSPGGCSCSSCCYGCSSTSCSWG
jgi:hypothetical protein